MVETDRNERLERLKAALLKWKEAHETEYNTFARSMRSGDASCYMRFYRSIVLMMPKFRKRWKHDWDSDTVDSFDDITIMVKKSDLPQDIVDKCVREDDSELPDSALPVSLLDKLRKLFGMKPKPRVRLSMPLVMCWLYFGKSFESMVEMLDSQLSSKDADTMDKEKCSIAVKAVIKASLSGGYRTQHDWDCYFAHKNAIASGGTGRWAMAEVRKEFETTVEKAQEADPQENAAKTTGRNKSRNLPLGDYISCDNTEAVMGIIRKFIIANNTGYGLTLPYFALRDLGLLKGTIVDSEYSAGLALQFSDIEGLKGESSVRQALGKMRKQQYVVIGGKQSLGTLLQSDDYAPLLTQLKDEISKA